jgi:hypothetical protein
MSKLMPKDFDAPAILLGGPVDYDMYKDFRPVPERRIGRHRIVDAWRRSGSCPHDGRRHSLPQREFAQPPVCLPGKGRDLFSGDDLHEFFAVENRYLTRGTRLMIHERKLDKTLHISGPLTTCVATVKATLHEIEASIAIQNEGFENLIRGSKVMLDDLLSRAPGNWYIEATEARSLGLVSDVL